MMKYKYLKSQKNQEFVVTHIYLSDVGFVLISTQHFILLRLIELASIESHVLTLKWVARNLDIFGVCLYIPNAL